MQTFPDLSVRENPRSRRLPSHFLLQVKVVRKLQRKNSREREENDMPMRPARATKKKDSSKLQGNLLRKSGAAHRMSSSAAVGGKTPNAQTTKPKRNKNLKGKASVK